MNEWFYDENGIGIYIYDQFILIKNDEKLLKYLAKTGIGSVELAKYLKKKYKDIMKKDINITVNSLAIEILGHVYIDKFAKSMKKLHLDKTWQEKINQFSNSLLSHTDVIDCGEKDVDSNREIWDMLSQEFYKDIIFWLLGKNA